VYIEAGEEHWHGAKPTRFMAHIAMKKPTTTVKSSPIRLAPRAVTPAASTRLAVVGNRGVAVVKDAASEHKTARWRQASRDGQADRSAPTLSW